MKNNVLDLLEDIDAFLSFRLSSKDPSIGIDDIKDLKKSIKDVLTSKNERCITLNTDECWHIKTRMESTINSLKTLRKVYKDNNKSVKWVDKEIKLHKGILDKMNTSLNTCTIS